MTLVPERLNRFQAELESAIGADLARRRRRARIVRPLAVAAAAGIVGAIVLPGALDGGPSVVDRAEAALATTRGELLHIRMVGQTTAKGSTVRWADEEWLVSGTISPRRSIQTAPDGSRFESGMTEDGLAEFYDPATNTIYAERVIPPSGLSDADAALLARRSLSPQERVKLLLAGGELRDAGRVSVDGHEAVKLVTKNGEVTYFVDPDTYMPIELRATGEGSETDLRFPVYEKLPPSALADGSLSLRAQHPDAAVKVGAEEYESRWAELAPPKP
jgi:hypothetical protein